MQFDITDPTTELKGHTQKIGYDIDGSAVFTTDASNHTTTVSYLDVFSVAPQNRNTFAYPTTLTDADNNSSFVTYNFDFGAQTKTQGPPQLANRKVQSSRLVDIPFSLGTYPYNSNNSKRFELATFAPHCDYKYLPSKLN